MQTNHGILAPQPRQGIAGSFYHPELDVLRFAAFLAVFMSHAFNRGPDYYIACGIPGFVSKLIAVVTSAGGCGVTLFFLLSSYLITTLLLREYSATGRLDLVSFYIRRTLRIWPLYFFFLILGFWVFPVFGWPPIPNLHKVLYSLFLGNWSIVLFQNGWQNPAFPSGTAISLLWSVSVEEQFYVFWPLALALIGVKHLYKLAFALLAAATLARLVLLPHHAGERDSSLWCNTFVQLDPIAIGALIAFAFRKGLPSITPLMRMLLLSFGLVIIPASFLGFGDSGWGVLATYPLAAGAMALVLMAALNNSPKPWLAGGPLVYLGKISYGLYVYHFFMLQLMARLWPNRHHWEVVLLAFTGTVVAAAVSYQLLERPFLHLKERFAHIRSRPV